jgi:hypothetical protein
MPLADNALVLIRASLEALSRKEKVGIITIGTLTENQFATLSKYRAKRGFPAVNNEIVFLGSHIYKRRIQEDGYTIDDVLDQIESAFAPTSAVINGTMSAIRNPNKRADRYGNQVRDEAVFECSARHPRPELFSIVPRGDNNKPAKSDKGHP